MKNLRWLALSAAVLAGLLTGAGAAAQTGPDIPWRVMAGGGAAASGGVISLTDTLGQPVTGPASGSGGLALHAGYWYACGATPAAMPDLNVARSGDDVELTWDAHPNNVLYQVWVSTDPYLDPNDPGPVTPVVTADAFFVDAGAAIDPLNHFYVVRGVNACGQASVTSMRKGKFTFELTKGSR